MSMGISEEVQKKASEWFFHQGVSTILLFIILVFIGYGVVFLVPSHIQLIQEGYEKNAAALEKSLDRVIESHEKSMERVTQMLANQTK